jgi:transposase
LFRDCRSCERFIEGVERSQSTLFPERLEDYIAEDNPVRVIDVFVESAQGSSD